MDKYSNKIVDFFYKRRLLDGYIGILGMVLWYKIMAVYFQSLHVFYLCLKNVFTINIEYRLGSEGTKFPKWIFQLSLFKWSIFDNAKEAYDDIHKWYEKYREESLAKEAKDKEEIAKKDALWKAQERANESQTPQEVQDVIG